MRCRCSVDVLLLSKMLPGTAYCCIIVQAVVVIVATFVAAVVVISILLQVINVKQKHENVMFTSPPPHIVSGMPDDWTKIRDVCHETSQ